MSNKDESSAEGLRDFLSSHRITEMSTNLSSLADGVEYTSVQITCVDGSQVDLQDYGKEALGIHKALEKFASRKKHFL